MISRSPKKKRFMDLITRQENFTESSLNKKLTKDGDQEVQIAGRLSLCGTACILLLNLP